MAIELHHLHPSHDDEMTRLKARIAELEKENQTLAEDVSDKIESITELMELVEKYKSEKGELEEELQELRGDKAQLEETVAVLQLNAKDKSAKADEINAIYQKSLARLEELVNKKYPDEEEDHSEADGILCDMLDALGYKDLTDAWDKIGKWYS